MRTHSRENPHARALLAEALATLALFAAHHIYGALRYDTPWRHHAAVVAFWVAILLLAAYLAHRRWAGGAAGRAAGWALVGVTLVVPVLLVGGYEGLYNHALKDLLWLLDAPRDLLLALFPPPTYEMPNDVLFEVSGVLQALLAAATARAALRFLRPRRVAV